MQLSSHLLTRSCGTALLFFGVSGCSLYQPLLTPLPAMRKPGDLAVVGNWQIPYGAQGAAIVSPVSHVLAFAGGEINTYNARRDSSNSYARSRQYEVGLGGYTTVGGLWLSAAVGAGQGRAYSYGRFEKFSGLGFGIPAFTGGSNPGTRTRIPELLGHYTTRVFLASAWWTAPRRPTWDCGASLRLTHIRFTDLTLNDVPQPLPSQYYLQASLVLQHQLWRRLQWHATASSTIALNSISNERAFASFMPRVGLGLSFCPTKAAPTSVPRPD